MVPAAPLPQKGVDLVNEDDARLGLARELEQRSDELIGLAEPLVREDACGDVDEGSTTLLRKRLREHRLPASRGSV